jgi:hypothetical protein
MCSVVACTKNTKSVHFFKFKNFKNLGTFVHLVSHGSATVFFFGQISGRSSEIYCRSRDGRQRVDGRQVCSRLVATGASTYALECTLAEHF